MTSLSGDDATSLSSSSLSVPSTSNSNEIAQSEQHEIDVIKAEIIWSLMTAEHDLPFLTSDHVSKAVSVMFRDSTTAANFKSGRTKTTYTITDGLSHEFQERLVKILKNTVFSLMIDESNKKYGCKYLFILVKYFCQEQGKVVIGFLDLHIVNKETADNIVKAIVNTFENSEIPFANLLHVMTDNPEVMRGRFNGVVTQLKNKYANHLLDIGGCSLHHVTNAVKNSVKELHMYEDIEDFVQDLYTFFSFHVEFADIFSDLQDTFDVVKHRLIQYSEIRFLSIYKVVVRCIEQYKPLKELFTSTIPKYHSKVRK